MMFQCDLGNKEAVEQMFQWINAQPDLGKVDICIANAGFATKHPLLEGWLRQNIKVGQVPNTIF